MQAYQSYVGFLALVLLVVVFLAIRSAHIRVEYSVSWLGAGAAVFLLSQWQSGLQWVSDFLGMPNAPSTLLFLLLSVFLVVFFRFTVLLSNLKDANIALTQRLAILEFQLKTIHEQNNSGK